MIRPAGPFTCARNAVCCVIVNSYMSKRRPLPLDARQSPAAHEAFTVVPSVYAFVAHVLRTVIVAVSRPAPPAYTMRAAPAASPVTTPDWFTVAVDASRLLQTPTYALFDGDAVPVSCSVPPSLTLA